MKKKILFLIILKLSFIKTLEETPKPRVTGQCPTSDKRCLSCKSKKCVACIESYINSKGQCETPLKEVPHCLTYKKDNFCLYCSQGFYTNSYGKCIEISMENCLELKDGENCNICRDNILVHKGVCKDKKKKCSIENCVQCAFDEETQLEKCILCGDYYALLINQGRTICKSEGESIKNCLYLNSNEESQCVVCDINYFWKKASCVKSDVYQVELDFFNIFFVGLCGFLTVFNF